MSYLKFIEGLSACFFAVVFFTACGGSKSVVQKSAPTPGGTVKGTVSTPEGLDLGDNECISLAEASPTNRAWGNAKHFDLSDAVSLAELDARSKMSKSISSSILAAEKRSGFDITKYSGSATEGAMATDGGEQRNNLATSISKNIVENTVTLKTKRFMLPNRMYNVFVTIEFQGGTSAMARKIIDDVKQRIPDEEKLKIQYELKKFEDEVQQELAKMK